MNQPAGDVVLDCIEVLRRADFDDAAKGLERKLAEPAKGKPVVLIVGEDKRGKSSLTNALLRIPDASPVGVSVVTGAPLTFFWSATPKAMVYRYGSRDAEPMEINRARELATVMGNPGNVENVRSVRLGVELPLLRELTLVDTPGVGGLSSGHGSLTMQSLRRADALVFVLEAGAQIRGSELEFLVKASERVDTVIIAVTKTDMHRGWRTIIADTVEILKQQAPRFADVPVVPVSNSLAFQGLRSSDPEESEDLREESGLTAMETVLREHVVSRVAVARRANLLRSAVSSLVPVQRMLSDQLSGGGDPRAQLEKLETERARLAELSRDRADWPQTLDTEMRKISLDRTEATSRRVAAIRHDYDQRLRKLKNEDRDSLPGELIAELAALEGELNEDAARRLSLLVGDLVDELESGSEVSEAVSELTEGGLSESLGSLAMGEHSLTMTDRLSVLSYFSRGRSLGSLLSGSGMGLTAGAFLTPPIGLVIGFGVGAVFAVGAFRSRGSAAFVTEFRSWMNEQISSAQLTLGTGWARKTIDLQAAIKTGVREILVEREKELGESVKALTEVVEAEAGARKQLQDRAHQRLTRVAGIQERVLAELEALKSSAAESAARAGGIRA